MPAHRSPASVPSRRVPFAARNLAARNLAARNLVVAGLVTAGLVVAGCSSSSPGAGGAALDAAATRGQQAATARGCVSCHTPDGRQSEGPTWKALYGSTVKLTDGSSVPADEAYLTLAIKEPRKQVVQGYRPLMPLVAIPDNEVADLVAYLKALK